MCGLGFVAEMSRRAHHGVVRDGIELLQRLAHRGAAGSDPDTGDGAGILVDIPDAVFRAALPFSLPPRGEYAAGMVFLSRDPDARAREERALEEATRHHGHEILGWRSVPVDASAIGALARSTQPVVRQVFIARRADGDWERALHRIRRRATEAARRSGGDGLYIASLSSRTIVYKGLLLPEQIDRFYVDLRDPTFASRFALVHSRFSTNTLPTWERAHPFRRLAHNGEINTLRGNQRWMSAREAALPRDAADVGDAAPIIAPGGSDSAALDDVIDFLLAGGRSLAHVMMMLVPEAWADHPEMAPARRAFYEYHAALVEPWDGPAALLFTDGDAIGAMLDRNGLRPLKYVVTRTGRVIAASELGVLDVDDAEVVTKGRVQPGTMLLVDLVRGRIVDDDAIKTEIATRKPYARWIAENKVDLAALPDVPAIYSLPRELRERMLAAFGATREDLRTILAPMAAKGEEPTGSMGNDAALAVLSDRPLPLFRYFKQQFAQVTNPPIDPIREELVMSLACAVGGEGSILDETPEQCRVLELPHPILTTRDLARLRGSPAPGVLARTLDALFPLEGDGAEALRAALDDLAQRAEDAVDEGARVIIVSDRAIDERRAAIPSLLAVSAVHHHLLRAGKRLRAGLIAESGEAREVHDVALLIGYGASAVNPYLALEMVGEMATSARWELGIEAPAAAKNYVQALKKGLLKVLSKMGISTISSYHGAQVFEAIGVGRDVIDRYFEGTASALFGIGLAEIADDARRRHALGFGGDAPSPDELDVGGAYAWRADGETHLWTPPTIAALQRAVRLDDPRSYAEYAARINDQRERPCTLRGLWDFVPHRSNIPLEDVEPAVSIVRRFATGAMSFGSISKEAHENLALAMNRIGGKSNSGEGGEDEARFVPERGAGSRRSAIKQVASARFGVTAHYLVNADEIQIKIAQGAKPGEGGQLPGHKVDVAIAKVRHATPGVTLISPPPHHDIYSIEDLAELIFDLRAVSAKARISVKLVAETGVGTIAAGVAKAGADAIVISGHDGGTGASPLSSIHHAGVPWEIGLAETQRTLVENGLRGRVRLQTDGQLKTGRDVAFAALLGAEEFGFATAPLVASGCIMMRKCHLNTCPVGVATQDPVLRARFKGQPEHVINYFFFVAEELRAIMARLGFATVDEMVGRPDHVAPRDGIAGRARLLDFGAVLAPATAAGPRHGTAHKPHGRARTVDDDVLFEVGGAIARGEPIARKVTLHNSDRAVGAGLAGEIARHHGSQGLPPDTVILHARGTAGQSFGAFAATGMALSLEGAANDYVGKGLSGGVLAIFPPRRARFSAEASAIVGNTVLYGATSGRAFFAGRAGERFAVRNSGATAVVEGLGDHGCEYMTGGVVVVLGATGRNFAAGMSGGVAYVLDDVDAAGGARGAFAARCNAALVDLEPLDLEDATKLRALIEEHVARTGSTQGSRLLASFAAAVGRFVKVTPREYKRAIGAARKLEVHVG